MTIIQLILIPALLMLTLLYVIRFRSRSVDRLIVLIIGVSGSVTVFVPELTQQLADKLGVGRGVDLAIYIAMTGLAFVCFLLFSYVRKLEERITELIRSQAIDNVSDASRK